MDLWILVTLLAGFCQNLRSALQKNITGRLSTTGASYARFFYAWPFGLLYLFTLTFFVDLPTPTLRFFVYLFFGSVTQIIFTVLLLWLFSFRSFAVGTTFSKLEVLIVAIFGFIILGDTINFYGAVAITVGSFGVILLSQTGAKFELNSVFSRPTLIGILCAACLGISSVFFRGAILSLEGDSFLMNASYCLSYSLILQTFLMGLWFIFFERHELRRLVTEYRRALPIGLSGMVTSALWFIAFSLQNAAYVRALGQIELVFTFLATIFFFRERVTATEVSGIIMILVSIILILLSA